MILFASPYVEWSTSGNSLGCEFCVQRWGDRYPSDWPTDLGVADDICPPGRLERICPPSVCARPLCPSRRKFVARQTDTVGLNQSAASNTRGSRRWISGFPTGVDSKNFSSIHKDHLSREQK